MTIAEQVHRWALEERAAILAEQPDVSPEQARAIVDCEDGAYVSRLLGEPVVCTCGTGHR